MQFEAQIVKGRVKMEKLFKAMMKSVYIGFLVLLLDSELLTVIRPGEINSTLRTKIIFSEEFIPIALVFFAISLIGFIGYSIVVCKQSKKDQSGPDKT